MKTSIIRIYFTLASLFLLTGPHPVLGDDGSVEEMTPARAVMCESVQDSAPVNQAAIFSIEVGKVACFTELQQLAKQTVIIHKWYRKDNLISVKRLSVNSTRRFTYSSMQLRNADKGPWRVEVTDAEGRLLATARFSITD